MKARIKEVIDNRWLIFGLRLVLGGIFIAASIGKLQYQTEFINMVIGYGILPDSLANAYGLIVPWVELFIGCSLVLGIFPRCNSAVSILLTISFAVASTYRLVNPVGGGCGCFGEFITLSHPASLSLDVVMLVIALLLLFNAARGEFLSIGSWLRRDNLVAGTRKRFIYETVSKLAIVVLAMVVVALYTGAAQVPLGEELTTDSGNQPPVIVRLTSEPSVVIQGETCTIECLVHDPDGDTLSYLWAADGGEISGKGSVVVWTAPNVCQTYTVAVTVADGMGGEASEELQIRVKKRGG